MPQLTEKSSSCTGMYPAYSGTNLKYHRRNSESIIFDDSKMCKSSSSGPALKQKEFVDTETEIHIRHLLISLADYRSIKGTTQEKHVDTATARSAWFLGMQDLKAIKCVRYSNHTNKYDLQDVICRSLCKYGFDSLVERIEQKYQDGHYGAPFLKLDQLVHLRNLQIKKQLNGYSDASKTRVYINAINELESKLDKNFQELNEAKNDRDEKCNDLHVESVADEPCPLKMKVRLMRYGWCKEKVKKLSRAREEMQDQLSSLATIHSEILSIQPQSQAKTTWSHQGVLGDSTNKRKPVRSSPPVLKKKLDF